MSIFEGLFISKNIQCFKNLKLILINYIYINKDTTKKTKEDEEEAEAKSPRDLEF